MQSSSCPALSIKSSEEGAWQEGYVGGPLSQNEAGEPGLENKSRGLLYPLTCCTPHITPHPQSDKAHSLAHMALHPTPRRFLSPLSIAYQYAYQLHCKIIFRRCLFLTPLSSFSPKRCHLTYFLTLLLALIFHKIFSANFKNIKHIMPLPCLKLSRGFL